MVMTSRNISSYEMRSMSWSSEVISISSFDNKEDQENGQGHHDLLNNHNRFHLPKGVNHTLREHENYN